MAGEEEGGGSTAGCEVGCVGGSGGGGCGWAEAVGS